jgi:DNA-binding response OmpR family regulator
VRVLLVEDDRPLAAAVRDGLTAAGFAVDAVTMGSTAREFLRLHSYECVVLDLGLPDEDGMTLLHDLRRGGDTIPILVLTARAGVPDRVAGLVAGADDYLPKPFAFPELVARVRTIVRRSASFAPSVLRVGDLEIDPGRCAVTRGGTPIVLTVKEFAILVYLASHAGQLVTRSMLLDQCWDASYDGLSNLVDVHVSRIRRKLDAAGAAPVLHTIRGAGFILGDVAR